MLVQLSPYPNIATKEELINACENSKLVLDLDTSYILKEIDLSAYTYEELKDMVLSKLEAVKGSTSVVDEISDDIVETLPMSKGD